MEEKQLQDTVQEQESPVYQPRPTWQRVLAWIGLGIVLIGVVLYYYHIARGGM